MKRLLFIFYLTISCLFAVKTNNIVRLEEVVITASRFEQSFSKTGSSVNLISANDLETLGYPKLQYLLSTISGLNCIATGPFGGLYSIFLRGAETKHVLIMLDSVSISDPANATHSASLENISIDSIARIEILKGNQSTLYGSAAMGGVINIITKKADYKTLNVLFDFETGSYNTFRESISVNGTLGDIKYFVSASREATDGISKAAVKAGDNRIFEIDPYLNTDLFTKISFSPINNFNITSSTKYTFSDTSLDNKAFVDELDNNKYSSVFFEKINLFHKFTKFWQYTLNYSFNNNKNHYKTISSEDFYTGNSQFINFQNDFLFGAHLINFGVDYNFDTIIINKSINDNINYFGTFIQYGYDLDKILNLSIGSRYDIYESIDPVLTYKATVAFFINSIGFKIHSSYGTGFKSPSLFQLFHPIWGNPYLKSEKSISWDIGITEKLNNNIILKCVYFNNAFNNLIDYDFTVGYTNMDKVNSYGVEAEIEVIPISTINIRTAYTYSITLNSITDEKLNRRPVHQLNINLNWKFLKKGNFNANISYTSESFDDDYSTWPATKVILDDYVKIDFNIMYNVNDYLTPHFRIENLLNAKYFNVYGYNTPGISFYSGVKIKL